MAADEAHQASLTLRQIQVDRQNAGAEAQPRRSQEDAHSAADGGSDGLAAAAPTPSELEMQRQWQKGWTPDRGKGYYMADRERRQRPSLVETGKNAGKSRVLYTNRDALILHSWRRDTFISALNTPLKWLLLWICVAYVGTFFFFAAIWWIIHVANPTCVYGMNGFAMAYNFSLVTQQTIGYGNTGPNDCYWASLVITIQTVIGIFMDSITLGIIFARISHPKNRGRTIGISDSAVISRRDGILKLMFRIADFRETQVVEPAVKAWLYTWGRGRTTAEGEHIPVRMESLEIHHIDGMLLLPIIIEHTIDERSPLCGHTFDSLSEINAEIVVTFEGTTEMGNPFMARQSYLPTEIHWGHQFCPIIRKPRPPSTRYLIEIERFHDVEPMPGLQLMPPGPLSKLVVGKSLRTVPYPLLGENTLVLSDSLVLAHDENGQLALMFRVGDTYPMQHLDCQLRMYLYRWNPHRAPDCGKPEDCEAQMLEVGYERGDDRVLLWLPWVGKHVICDDSPLAAWRQPSGVLQDANSTIVLTVEAYMYVSGQNRMRMRVYNVLDDVRPRHAFEPMVTPPFESADFKPRVDWHRFHLTRPLSGAAPPKPEAGPQPRQTADGDDATTALAMTGFRRQQVRRPTALSKLSFVPLEESPEVITTDRTAEGGEGKGNGPAPAAAAAAPRQGSSDLNLLHSMSFAPPEAGSGHLTPWTDPESTFAQRPAPPGVHEHSVVTEGQEGTWSLGSRGSLSALARNSAASLRKAFSKEL